MLIVEKDFDIVINLDKVKEICLDGYNNNEIIFMFNDRTQKEIYAQDRNEIFNDIIANYNSGKKVYEIG